jgi:hypothetical protein
VISCHGGQDTPPRPVSFASAPRQPRNVLPNIS